MAEKHHFESPNSNNFLAKITADPHQVDAAAADVRN
jgi:hypothetical protein